MAASGYAAEGPAGDVRRGEGDLRLLAVCRGNICRSPALERILRHGLEGSDVEVSSAGTQALVGQGINPPMADLLVADGLDPADFAARQVDADVVEEADLVVVMTRRQRKEVLALNPAAVRRTFTLLELARVAHGLGALELDNRVGYAASPGARLAELVSIAVATPRPPLPPELDDMVDPYGLDLETYERVFSQIRSSAGALLRAAGR